MRIIIAVCLLALVVACAQKTTTEVSATQPAGQEIAPADADALSVESSSTDDSLDTLGADIDSAAQIE